MAVKDRLPPGVVAVERKLKAGQALFRLGSRTAGLYEVTSGKLRLVRVDPAGREAVLHVAAAGDTVAEASLFSPTYHCDALATTNAVVRLYPKDALLAQLQSNPSTAKAFMAMLGRQDISLRTRLEQRNIRSARERIRHHLAVSVGADRRTVVLPGTLKDLAADLGLTHEALYRTLAQMKADGEIARLRGKIRLIHPDPA
jgi:CRP/FNR family transcriptional regulator, dissimilatory nitrate respiration regulator